MPMGCDQVLESIDTLCIAVAEQCIAEPPRAVGENEIVPRSDVSEGVFLEVERNLIDLEALAFQELEPPKNQVGPPSIRREVAALGPATDHVVEARPG